MTTTPEVLVLDVNETLSDLEPLRPRLERAGLPAHALEAWFAATLRDGFALTAAGGYAPFRDLAADALRTVLAAEGVDDADAVDEVLAGFAELPAHPDVGPGLRRIHDQGVRLVTLTNGASAMSEQMLRAAGVLPLLEQRLSVEQPHRWKPHVEAYRYAAAACGVEPARMALVAVHPWDIDGARRAGLTGIWIDRKGSPYPRTLLAPSIRANDLEDLADILAAAAA